MAAEFQFDRLFLHHTCALKETIYSRMKNEVLRNNTSQSKSPYHSPTTVSGKCPDFSSIHLDTTGVRILKLSRAASRLQLLHNMAHACQTHMAAAACRGPRTSPTFSCTDGSTVSGCLRRERPAIRSLTHPSGESCSTPLELQKLLEALGRRWRGSPRENPPTLH